LGAIGFKDTNNMGMYDSIWVNCPKCNKESEFQSKGGDCYLSNYTLENCPNDVLKDANRHSPNKCDCGAVFEIDIELRKPIQLTTKQAPPNNDEA